MKRVVIVIPIHKEKPNESELASFAQCFNILGNHHITVLAPDGLNLHAYENVVTNFQRIFIDPDWLSSVEKYNKLKISFFFYSLFGKYKYLLTYELDAWVFKDELEFWCKKGYDYIGAPWTGIHPYENERLLGVGNSGFSIRSIRNSIRTLKNIEILAILNQYKHYNWKGLLPRLPLLLFKLMVPFKYSKTSYGFDINEDLFWCKYAPSLLDQIKYDSLILELAARLFIKNNFKIAPEEIALQFSFETEGRKFYKLNNEKLPFGCHGWEKYEPDFWKEFIPVPIKDYSKGFDHN